MRRGCRTLLAMGLLIVGQLIMGLAGAIGVGAALGQSAGTSPDPSPDPSLDTSLSTSPDTSRGWSIQLQGDLTPLRAARTRLLVADIQHVRTNGGLAPLQQGPNGRRTVLSYLSIGEAETSRPYWQQCCRTGKPAWLSETTQGWAGNYVVQYWNAEWQAIVRNNLMQIVADGYDGVYLDRVDSWEAFAKRRASARTDMIDFVLTLARDARAIRPGFQIFVQNGEELLEDARYVAAIDGIGKEDLYHGVNHDQARNPATMIAHSCALLDVVVKNKKPVLVLEYLPDGPARKAVAKEAEARGYVITFTSRAVDGTDQR